MNDECLFDWFIFQKFIYFQQGKVNSHISDDDE